MDQPARQHIRLILEDASDRLKQAVNGKIQALHRTQASRGMLQSGNTLISSIAIIEEEASRYITDIVDGVSAIAKDVEAFALIEENFAASRTFLTTKMTGIVDKAFGAPGSVFGELGHRKAALDQFRESLGRLQRKLELHRFTFTVLQKPTPIEPASAAPAIAEKPKGGKPLAAHWDEMWAAIAVALHTGDLQPKTQADIERAMNDWLASKAINAADSSVRKRAQQLWRKLREAD